jgi:tetratricopeptide (TPR) repeat protein
MFTRPDMGWLWLIPLSDTVMSVGAVIPRATHRQQAQATAEDSLAHYLADTPPVLPLLEQARRISPARFEADYSYLATRMAGDRWVAVGDAAAAVKDLEAVLVEFPQALDANFHLARLRELAGDTDGAIAAYRAVVQAQPVLGANPATAPARLYLGRALQKKGDTAAAREQLDALTAQWKDADADFPWRQQARKPQ